VAEFLNETFTATDGTTIPAHSAAFEELGWDLLGAAVTDQHTILANHATAAVTTSPGSRVLRCTTDPGSDEYDVEVAFTFRPTAQANRYHALLVRMHPTATDYATCDHYRIFASTNDVVANWQLSKVIGGAGTQLDNFVAATAGTTAPLLVEVRSTGIQVFLSGSLILETTDTAVPHRGRIGFGSRRGQSGVHYIDDLVGDSISGAGGQAIEPGGIASTTSVGTPTLQPGPVTAAPAGISSSAIVGQPTLTATATIAPDGIASTAVVGTPTLTSVDVIAPDGIASTTTVGTPVPLPGIVTITPTGIPSTLTIGTPTFVVPVETPASRIVVESAEVRIVREGPEPRMVTEPAENRIVMEV